MQNSVVSSIAAQSHRNSGTAPSRHTTVTGVTWQKDAGSRPDTRPVEALTRCMCSSSTSRQPSRQPWGHRSHRGHAAAASAAARYSVARVSTSAVAR